MFAGDVASSVTAASTMLKREFVSARLNSSVAVVLTARAAVFGSLHLSASADHLGRPIFGAGPIGLEFGYVFRSYGADVTIIEMLPHLAPLEDEEVSIELEKHYKKLGVKVLTNTRVESLKKTDTGVEAVAGGQTITGEKAIVAIGFAPNSDGIGLENAGVKVERGQCGLLAAGWIHHPQLLVPLLFDGKEQQPTIRRPTGMPVKRLFPAA